MALLEVLLARLDERTSPGESQEEAGGVGYYFPPDLSHGLKQSRTVWDRQINKHNKARQRRWRGERKERAHRLLKKRRRAKKKKKKSLHLSLQSDTLIFHKSSLPSSVWPDCSTSSLSLSFLFSLSFSLSPSLSLSVESGDWRNRWLHLAVLSQIDTHMHSTKKDLDAMISLGI